MGKYSRDKGARFERDIASVFRALFPLATIKRGSQAAGATEGDICIPDLPVRLECKVGSHPYPAAALDQCTRDARPNETPIAITRTDRCVPMVSMGLASYIIMLALLLKIDPGPALAEIKKRGWDSGWYSHRGGC
jgi:hypothetical protein